MSSTIPAVLNELQQIAATTLPDLQLGRGQLLQTENDFLVVAYRDGDTPPVRGTRAIADAGMGSDFETYDVSMLLSAWDGDADQDALDRVTARLFDYLNQYETALRPGLNVDGVMQAMVSEYELDQSLVGEGATATVGFTITIRAIRGY